MLDSFLSRLQEDFHLLLCAHARRNPKAVLTREARVARGRGRRGGRRRGPADAWVRATGPFISAPACCIAITSTRPCFIQVFVMKANPRARALYERLGFVDAEQLLHHFRMTWPVAS
jgi:hypothetical protein